VGRFVGKGEGEDLLSGKTTFDHSGDPLCQHTGLACTGPGQDQKRPVPVGSSALLLWIEDHPASQQPLPGVLASFNCALHKAL
jgi:hypothetical protein